MKRGIAIKLDNPLLPSVCLIRIVFSMLNTILALYLFKKGFSTVQIGIIIGTYGYAACFMDLTSSIFIDNVKKTFIIKVGILLISISLLGYYLSYYLYENSIVYYCFLQMLLGFSLGLFRPASMALSVELTVPKKSGSALGLYNISYIIGDCLGPIIAALLMKSINFYAVFIVAFIVALGALIYAVLILNFENLPQKKESFYPKHHLKKMLQILLNNKLYIPITFILVDVLILRLWMTYLPLFIKEQSNLDIGQIGIIFSVQALMYIITQPFWGKRVDMTGYNIPLMVGLISPLIIILTPSVNSFMELIVLYAIFGMLVSAAYPTYMSLAVKFAGEEEKGRVMSLMAGASDIGHILGPLLGGVVFSLSGSFSSIFYFSIVPCCIGLLVMLFSSNYLKSVRSLGSTKVL